MSKKNHAPSHRPQRSFAPPPPPVPPVPPKSRKIIENGKPPPPPRPPGVRYVKDGVPSSKGFTPFCAGIICGWLMGCFSVWVILAILEINSNYCK